jgi:ArsR family transcriptional regulator
MTDTISTGALDARFQALSDEKRLRILELLRDGEACVCELTEAMDVSQSLLSFHLKKLKEAGLVRDRREGRWAYYRLNTGGFVELRDRLDELAGTGEASAETPPYRCC